MQALAKVPGWVIGAGVVLLGLFGIALVRSGSEPAPESTEPNKAPRAPKSAEPKMARQAPKSTEPKKAPRARKSAPKRRVFFSFHYQRDIWRVNQIRNAGVVDAAAAAGWADASLWEEAKKKGDAAIKRLIDEGLKGTTVTAVLIGGETAQRKYVNYEIEKSLEQGNGVFGVRIHALADQEGQTHKPGAIPDALLRAKARIYDWDREQFGAWVQKEFRRASKRRELARGAA